MRPFNGQYFYFLHIVTGKGDNNPKLRLEQYGFTSDAIIKKWKKH